MIHHASPSASPPLNRWALRFALLGGGVAWLLHLVICYLIAEFGLLSGLDRQLWAGGIDAVSWLLLGCTAVMLTLAVAATEAARRVALRPGGDEEVRLTASFCSRFGMVTNAAFVAIIVAQTVPILFHLRQ